VLSCAHGIVAAAVLLLLLLSPGQIRVPRLDVRSTAGEAAARAAEREGVHRTDGCEAHAKYAPVLAVANGDTSRCVCHRLYSLLMLLGICIAYRVRRRWW
jgi:hypothetical protein